MVSPEMVTVLADAISKTREELAPLTARLPAPRPRMVRFLLMPNSPYVRGMVWPARLASKTIRSPLLAAPIASRKDSNPSPGVTSSKAVVTCRVEGTTRSSKCSTLNRQRSGLWPRARRWDRSV